MNFICFTRHGLLLLLGMCVSHAQAQQPATPSETRTVSFQQGVNGYTGTVDTEIWALRPYYSRQQPQLVDRCRQ
jgi:hypothetical protein